MKRIEVGITIWGRGVYSPGTVGGWSWFSKLYVWMIQFFTKSPYVHVGVLVESNEDPPYLVEAVVPKVKKRFIKKDEKFMYIPVGTLLGSNAERAEKFLHEKVGHKYSIPEAMLSVLNLNFKHDNKWFCSELVSVFLEDIMDMDGVRSRFTPTQIVEYLLTEENKVLYLRKGVDCHAGWGSKES